MTTFRFQGRGRLRLPLDDSWNSEDEYVQSVLTFATTSDLFRNLCGGVHILDFLTREPDLYTTILPKAWRDWFDLVDVDRVLDLLLRDDLEKYKEEHAERLEGKERPPEDLLDYIRTIRRHSLQRDFTPSSLHVSELPRHVSVGMKTKKIHEVTHFASYVGSLCDRISSHQSQNGPSPQDHNGQEMKVVDFGSGQNYLGRTLASPPYNKHVIAIEKRHHNILGARGMDVHAKLATKEKIMRNKKEWKRMLAEKGMPTPPSEVEAEQGKEIQSREEQSQVPLSTSMTEAKIVAVQAQERMGSMTYIEHDIQNGYLEDILYPYPSETLTQRQHQVNQHLEPSTQPTATPLSPSHRPSTPTPTPSPIPPQPPPPPSHPQSIIISLHSCGNLSHHALRALPLNLSIRAVAVIGCCYNLLTERLGPATYKHPQLRPNHPRLISTGEAYDPAGFPMSRTLENFSSPSPSSPLSPSSPPSPRGVRLNITSRMMAVQAPKNWGPHDTPAFFSRHFYRTLLQKILLDLGVVHQCPDPNAPSQLSGGSITGRDDQGTPLIVGTLPKKSFANFRTYVRAALQKLSLDPADGVAIKNATRELSDEMIDEYEQRFGYAKKQLAVMWSLMAVSAGVVESIIVMDRWLYLRELECVMEAWVEIAFEYGESPRNFVVVGVKKSGYEEEGKEKGEEG